MSEMITKVFVGCWSVLTEMAPYLLFGFLVAGVLSVIISRAFVEKHLGGRGIGAIFKASLLGVPMPLCSCSVIPVAAGLRQHGASKGATASFLASTPQTGIDSIAVTYSLLGGAFTLFRVVVAFITGLLCGTMVETCAKSDDDAPAEEPAPSCCCCCGKSSQARSPFRQMLEYGFLELPKAIGRALLIGIVVSAVLGALVPDNFFVDRLSSGPVTMLVMLAIGTPLYVCSTASIPIAMALMTMGVSPGAALVFLISGPATNAAALSTMWKMLGRRATIIYLSCLFLSAIGAGLLFDVLPFAAQTAEQAHQCEPSTGWFKIACTIVLLILLIRPALLKKTPA